VFPVARPLIVSGRNNTAGFWLTHSIPSDRLDCADHIEAGLFLSDHGLEYGILGQRTGSSAMEEREFFTETTEQRKHSLNCPHCGQAGEYTVTWVVRRKRAQLPRHADERDRARFAKAQSYMVRRDDQLGCMNMRCRKRFEINTLQSLAFLE
jgi:hypothetical protein